MIAALVLLASLVAASQATAIQTQSTSLQSDELHCLYFHSSVIADSYPICIVLESTQYVRLVPDTVAEVFKHGSSFIHAISACGPKPECLTTAVKDLTSNVAATKDNVARKISFFNHCLDLCH